MIFIMYVSTSFFITQSKYIGYMFRLLNSHLQAYSLQVKSQDAVHTLGSRLHAHFRGATTTMDTLRLHYQI